MAERGLNPKETAAFHELEVRPRGFEKYGQLLLGESRRIKSWVTRYTDKLASLKGRVFVIPPKEEHDRRERIGAEDRFNRDLQNYLRYRIVKKKELLAKKEAAPIVRWICATAVWHLTNASYRFELEENSLPSITLTIRRTILAAEKFIDEHGYYELDENGEKKPPIDREWLLSLSLDLWARKFQGNRLQQMLETFVNNPPRFSPDPLGIKSKTALPK